MPSSPPVSDHGGYFDGATAGLPKLERPRIRTLGKLRMRGQDDHDPTDWWFASTAIPLVAATFAPMANLLSIAALVVPWRNEVLNFDDPLLRYSEAEPVGDPKWCYNLNVLSLACGFMGNLFLLFNFTQRVRYIIALPVTIFFFYMASGILIGIVVSMHQYTPPEVDQVYSQGYWHAVIAACLYLLNSMILMVNMAGYFLGHYPQHFTLTDEQRNLILQTMLFFIWLGGGAYVFTRVQKDWSYPDALYFCDVTILTIGFGDYFASGDVGRGLVFPFSVGGTIILGLMVNSIHKFARELSKEKVVRKHVEQRRLDTLSRAVSLNELDDKNLNLLAEGKMPNISSPLQSDKDHLQQRPDELAQQEREKRRMISFEEATAQKVQTTPDIDEEFDAQGPTQSHAWVPNRPKTRGLLQTVALPITKPVSMTTNGLRKVTTRTNKKILMIEERDRFNAMRHVQRNASRFNRYYALTMSIISFGMLWCLGAMVFFFAEAETQHLNYFQGLYFCYVSLLTIGYGDLSPKSNAGKSFFVVWSLIAVPTMTILVSDLGDTVIGGFKRGVLHNDLGLTSSSSSEGRTANFIRRVVQAASRFYKKQGELPGRPSSNEASTQNAGMPLRKLGDARRSSELPETIDDLVEQDLSEPEMLRMLAFAIRRTAEDLRNEPGKKYRYEDWVEFTRLIRFSKAYASGENNSRESLDYDEATDGIVDWDWLDDKSPMTSDQSESEWVLDRLCESLLRIFKSGDLPASILPGAVPQAMGLRQDLLSNSFLGSRRKDRKSTASDSDEGNSPLQPEKTMGTIARLLQGEAGHGALKWSRRAQTRRNLARHGTDRRRSSNSVKHRRSGPFATSRQHPCDRDSETVGTEMTFRPATATAIRYETMHHGDGT